MSAGRKEEHVQIDREHVEEREALDEVGDGKREEEAVAGIEVASEKTAGGEAGEEKSAESSDAE